MVNLDEPDARGAGSLRTESVRLPPELPSCSRARRLVVERVHQWELDRLSDAAAMCATELATNAVLHSRQPFVLTVSEAGGGLRIDVLDNCPQNLPITTPLSGIATDLTSWGTGGRGLQIVASLAQRWGVFTTEEAKTVWVEVRAEPTMDPPAPVLNVGTSTLAPEATVALVFRSLPVRAAVASGIQTEEVIREIQLDLNFMQRPVADTAWFFALVDRSAPIRLAGRHAALRAAAEGQERFDLTLRTTEDALVALPLLSDALASFQLRHDAPHPVLTDDVVAFRSWLNEEVVRQRTGDAPVVCPLP